MEYREGDYVPTLTVFTPTYNRAYCLHEGFEALCRQTCSDFEWLIVDDGSDDDTETLVRQWMDGEHGFRIRYIKKENGGLYSGYLAAIREITTELCVCVDSDDHLTDDAVEKILTCWKQNRHKGYAGIVGLNCTPQGKTIGDRFPERETINMIDLLIGRYKIRNGDRKNVVLTELYREAIPDVNLAGEKDFNPHFLLLEICKRYDFLMMNEHLCVVDYQPDGMSTTVWHQYARSPRSYRLMRLMDLSLKGAPFPFLCKKTIHYIAACRQAKLPCLEATPHKLLAVIMYPLGVAMQVYIKLRNEA